MAGRTLSCQMLQARSEPAPKAFCQKDRRFFLLEKSDTADKQREDTAKEPFGKQDICKLFRIAFFGKGGILLS